MTRQKPSPHWWVQLSVTRRAGLWAVLRHHGGAQQGAEFTAADSFTGVPMSCSLLHTFCPRLALRAVLNPDDVEARSIMHLASVFAGIGFGNAGVNLCHGMSYPTSGNIKTHKARGYKVDHPLVPHGLSVVLTSPAVFAFAACMCPERHLEAAEILVTLKREDAGHVLADILRNILYDLEVEDGLSEIGYSKEDIPELVAGTIPQAL